MNASFVDRGGAEQHNPFATKYLRPGALEFVFSDDERFQHALDLIRQLELQGFRGQIVGPHGSGKSTLMRCLASELEAAGNAIIDVRLNDQSRRLPTKLASEMRATGKRTVVLLDGFEQLTWWRRAWLRTICGRNQVGLVVTAHNDMGLPDLYRTEVTLDTAQRVIESLCRQQAGAVASDQLREHVDRLTRDLSTRLAAHRGNLRELLFELYDEVVSFDSSVPTK